MREPHIQPGEGSTLTHSRPAAPDEVERPSSPCVSWVIVEDGANRAEGHALPNGADDTLCIAQHGGERSMDFARRVIRRIVAFEHADRSIVSTRVLLSPRFDNGATAARLALGYKLMTHSAAALGSSELVLSAGSDLHPSLQAKVLALAELLMADPRGNALLVTEQFASSGEPQVRLILGGCATVAYQDIRLRYEPRVSDSTT